MINADTNTLYPFWSPCTYRSKTTGTLIVQGYTKDTTKIDTKNFGKRQKVFIATYILRSCAKTILNINKDSVKTLTEIITGHGDLRRHLDRVGQTKD